MPAAGGATAGCSKGGPSIQPVQGRQQGRHGHLLPRRKAIAGTGGGTVRYPLLLREMLLGPNKGMRRQLPARHCVCACAACRLLLGVALAARLCQRVGVLQRCTTAFV